jgi:hypothetical protein
MTATSSSPLYNVRDYGATGDGKTDDTAAILEAITAAAPPSAPTGNTVYLPAGKYLVSSTLAVPPALSLQGAGWNTPGAQVNTFAGSWIFVEAGAGFSPVSVSGSGGAVRALGFNVPNQSTAGPPASAQPMILVGANNAIIEDICLYNPYGGIYINNAAQACLRRIFGQPVHYGIIIDGSRDTNYVDTVHFWPYWQPTTTTVGAYQLANGVAIGLLRCDNPHFSNIFAFNYNKGLSLSSSSTGIPHKVHLMNADFDRCVTGVHIGSPGAVGSAATIQMVNVTIQSPTGPGVPAGNGIWVEAAAAYAMVQASNVRVSNSGLNAVRIDADNVNFFGENISLENWRGNGGFYISSPSSFAHLGVGCTPGDAPYAPRSQFRRAQLA